jgi:hypothetical protein
MRILQGKGGRTGSSIEINSNNTRWRNAEQQFVKKKHLTPMPQYSRIAKVGAEKEIHREKKHGENRRTGSAL